MCLAPTRARRQRRESLSFLFGVSKVRTTAAQKTAFVKRNPRRTRGFLFYSGLKRGSFVFICFSVCVFAAGGLFHGAAHAAGGAASAAAVASAFVIFAPFHDGNDGEYGCRKDDRRKHKRDGEPRSRQRCKDRVCRTAVREYSAR